MGHSAHTVLDMVIIPTFAMKIRYLSTWLFLLPILVGSASCVRDDFEECPNDYRLKIVYTRNMLNADAFASMVKEVDIKVFSHDDRQLVYRHRESGEALASDNYEVVLPIGPGQYDILCWAGMAEGSSFGYANPQASGLEMQNVVLSTEDSQSVRLLDDLFHGLSSGVTFTDNNLSGYPETQYARLELTKNTNRIHVILHNLDGTTLDKDGFSLSISSKNGEMGFDNSISAAKAVDYLPWSVNTIHSESDDSGTKAPVPSALGAEFSVGRLMPDGGSVLNVVRNSDNVRIISIPLERNLLLYKGAFHDMMADQEYLDRQDNYTITFILDHNNNWDKAAMILINDWATLPVQFTEW